ncbi:hypothetical protein KEM48_013887 [Puccinia striiformis f. sp. tritici PST-130]|nr:hypothetical protein KEM48_013887 [Puccinia striiformis f. sp. tritici PST-130]
MSVVVRRLGEDGPEPGELYLLVKGADNVIFERLGAGQDELKQTTDDQLEQFASEGLRTLCLAYRKLESSELEAWSKKYAHACSQLGPDREKFIDRVQDELERDLILLGATAIEDKLQEGVPRAIADLKRAGIKSGSPQVTNLRQLLPAQSFPLAIARTCHLIGHDMNLIVIRGGEYGSRTSAYQQIRKSLIDFFDGRELVDQLKELPPDHSPEPGMQSPTPTRVSLPMSTRDDLAERADMGLVIDGASLNHALEEPFTREALLELATRCAAVVCCRTSPKQKSEIVRLVKEGIGAQTLAIGDGANDVSMIQTADIGVGVSGEEGMQAVNSSDYAIAKFRFLTKLLFVHGHWSYDRNARMIGNFFYKEIIGIVALWLFQFWCAYSTTFFMSIRFYLLFYNVFWTLLPVIGIGVFDQDVAEKVLIAVPELYSIGREGHLFGLRRFVMYMLQGIYQGSVCFFLITFAYDSTSARNDGFDVSMNEFSTVVIIAIIIACNFFHGIDQWTASYGNNHFFWPSAYFWLGLLITVVLSLGPHYLFKYYQEMYYPNDLQILKYVHKHDPDHDFRRMSRCHTSGRTRTRRAAIIGAMKSEAPSSLQPVRPEILRSRTSLTHDMATGQLSPMEEGSALTRLMESVNTRLVTGSENITPVISVSLGAAIPEEANNGNTTKSKTSRSGRLGNLQRAFGGGSFGTQHRRQGTQATTAGSVSRPASLAKRITSSSILIRTTITRPELPITITLTLPFHSIIIILIPPQPLLIILYRIPRSFCYARSSNDEIQEVHPPDLHSSSQYTSLFFFPSNPVSKT